MPGCARRVRAAYSRALCLPCLKAGFFCFLHYRYRLLYVQLFIFNFLCICLLLFGTSFFSCPGSKFVPPTAFHLCRTNLHRSPTQLQQGRSGASVVSFPYLAFKTAHSASQGELWFFVSQNEVTPPPKGGGAGYRLSWVRRIRPARSKLGHARPTGPVRGFAGVVLLPSHLTGHKSPHRAGFGFGLLAGASLRRASLFEIPYKNSGRRKITPALFLKIRPG